MGRPLILTARWCLIVLLSMSLCAALPTAARAQAPAEPASHGAAVHGRLADPSGLPVARATVTLRSVLSGALETTKTTADGRFTVIMPHPERVTRNVMMSWAPEKWGTADTGGPFSPWMRIFRNARAWLK